MTPKPWALKISRVAGDLRKSRSKGMEVAREVGGRLRSRKPLACPVTDYQFRGCRRRQTHRIAFLLFRGGDEQSWSGLRESVPVTP
jgi:hypothetical protein